MYIIDKNIINKIINETDLVELIGEDIDLHKKGSNFVGLCPFHQDNNPSFTVSPAKHIYKCFVCDQGGNAITYLQDKRNMSYQDSVKLLADKLNIKVKKEKKIEQLKEHILLGDVAGFYQTVLLTMKSGGIGRDYLTTRKIEKDIYEDFRLGYASSDCLLHKYLENQITDNHQYSSYEVEQASLIYGQNEFFKERLVIPIMDEYDRVVGFSGRALGDENPKYLNSKDSKIFQKKKVLYNLNRAKKYINDETIIIVEGYFDVIALAQIGINNVVAIMGTAFGVDHINLLKKYKVKNIIMCLDQDDAGVKSTIKIGELLLKNNVNNISVITYNDVKDIDEYIKLNNGVDQLFAKPKDYFEFKIDKLKPFYDLDSIDGKVKYLKVVLNGIQAVEMQKQNIIKIMLSDIVGMDIEKVLSQTDIMTQPSVSVKPVVENKVNTVIEVPVVEEYNVDDYIPPMDNEDPGQYYDEAFIQPVAPSPQPVNKGVSKVAPSINKVTNNQPSKRRTNVPTDEDALVQYALVSQANCREVLVYVTRENINFVNHKILFDALCEYYKLHQEFDMLEFMNVSHPHDFLNEINTMKNNETIDMQKIHLIFEKDKQRVAGRNMFRKNKR